MANSAPAPAANGRPPTPAARAAQQEMASRILSRRKLLPFIQRMNPKYLAGWVHEDICRRLERFSDDVAAGLSPRLMLLMPPRSGKSEIASKTFPAWHMGRHADHEIIACSYNVGLAMDFSKKVKALLEDQAFQTVFEIRLDPENKSSENWGLLKQPGGYVAAGVGGGITGKGCLLPHCHVNSSRGNIPASRLRVGDPVYGYNHETNRVEETRVVAINVSVRNAPVVWCGAAVITVDHPVFAGDKYLPAHSAQGMPGVWLAEGADSTYVQSMLFEDAGAGPCWADLRMLREDLPAAAGRARQVSQPEWRYRPYVLLQGLLHRVQAAASGGVQYLARGLRWLWETARWQGAEEVLLSPVLHGVQGKGSADRELWDNMAGGEGDDLGARPRMHTLRGPEVQDGGPSRRSRPGEPRREEPRPGVHAVPQEISFVHGTCAEDIADLLPSEDYVVDFQTGTGNFFAGDLLVHNCHILIIDDPVKNAEEADSATSREAIWNWYGSTAYTRLAPGGGVLVVQTWWHDDDLAGRLQAEMAAARPDDPDIDRFEVIKYPAIAEHDEYLDDDSDLIVYDTAPVNGRLLRNKGEALHPARFDVKKLNGIKRTIPARFWAALYQQNPVPDDGAYFTKDQFKRGPLPPLRNSKVFIAWDFAISEKAHNDYTVGTVGLQDYDDMLHPAEVVRFKSGDAFFIVESILDLCKRWYHPSLVLGFEDGQIYRSIEALLKKRMRETKFYPSIQVLRPITDKMARARVLQGRMQQGRVSFNQDAEWYDTVRNEMLRFPAGVHDDCVDSLAWMAQLAVGSEPPKDTKTKPFRSWKDKLRGATGDASHMAA